MSLKCHLLHVCCAPDLVIAYLAGARGDVFFYNPNIHPKEEYEKRKHEVLKVARLFNLEVVEAEYDPENFFKSVRGLEHEPEGGNRCRVCFELRLRKTASVVKELGYASFSTTLTASPKKDVHTVNEVGKTVALETGTVYLANVYRKSPAYNDAQRLTKLLGIYRQNYCGCAFSRRVGQDENPSER